MSTSLFDRYSAETKAKFHKFHAANPHVWEMFKRMSFQIKATGRKRYSAETIFNAIRWHTDLNTTGDAFKINNNYRSIYARMMIHNYPTDFTGFFVLREKANT